MARNILIVHSSPTMRKIIGGMIMANLGDIEIFEAKSAYEAWDQLQKQVAHLILFSWEPSGDAWTNFFLRLKKNPTSSRAGSILLTSDAKRPYVKDAMAAGVSETLVIPCTKLALTNAINRVCNPVTLRKTPRYSLQGATALLQQDGRSYHASVINVSRGGLFCEFDFIKDLTITSPVTINITFQQEGQQIVASSLYSTLTRFCVLDINADYSPNRVRVAYRFVKAPPAVQDIFEKVFYFADEQENLLQAEN